MLSHVHIEHGAATLGFTHAFHGRQHNLDVNFLISNQFIRAQSSLPSPPLQAPVPAAHPGEGGAGAAPAVDHR